MSASCAWRGLLPLVAILVACRPPERHRGPDVLLVVLDTVRRDHVSVYGYPKPTTPFLEEVAANGTIFENAFSTSTWTLPAHASMFTGQLPAVHHADQDQLRIDRGLPMLAELLSRQGYQTAAFVNNPWLSDDTGLSQGFEVFDALWKGTRTYPAWRPGHPTLTDIKGFFERDRDAEKPLFMLVNLMEAHGPYTPRWSTARHFFPDRDAFAKARETNFRFGAMGVTQAWYLKRRKFNADVFEKQRGLYDAEIRAADELVRQIVEVFDTWCDPETSTLLVVSDHGQNFGDHELAGHVFGLYQSTLGVAFIAKGPGFGRGLRSTSPVSLTDVFPTVLRIAGTSAPEGIDGRNLQPDEAAPADDRVIRASYAYPYQALSTFPEKYRRIATLAPYKRALVASVEGRYKLVRGSDGWEEIFDLAVDPDEEHPLRTVPDGVRDRLGALAGDFPALHREPTAAPALSPETAEALRQLGYVQ